MITTESPPIPPTHPPANRLLRLTKHWAYSAFVVLSDLYGVSVTLLLIARGLVGERLWPVEMFNSLFPAILLPAFVIVPGGLLLRRRRLTALAVLPLLMFIFSYGGFFLPRSAGSAPDAPTFSILTFNIHAETRETALDEMARLILDADADFVSLQEFTQHAADRFGAALAARYPYQALYPVGRTVLGKGFYSRYPLLSSEIGPREDLPKQQRNAVDYQGVALVIYNAHPTVPRWSLPYSSAARQQDITNLLEATEAETAPLVIAGDFNMTDQANDYARMTARYHDAFRDVGFGLGLTFPDYGGFGGLLALAPQIIRLDYVFHNDALESVEAYVLAGSAGSDHRPVFARLALSQEDGSSR